MTCQNLIFTLIFTTLPTWAGIHIRSNIHDVFYPHKGQAMGAVWFFVDDNDFHPASPQNPIYISMQLDHGITLCETLVGPNGPAPIYMPMHLDGGPADDVIAADVETASIVRWVAGEDQIWLKIQSDSSTWIKSESGLVPPDRTRHVGFNLGVSARISDEDHVTAAEHPTFFNANLPYHTRNPHAAHDIRDAVSTLLCTDLTEAVMEAVPSPRDLSIANFDLATWMGSRRVETASELKNIHLGTPWSAGFTYPRSIGRAITADACNITVTPVEKPTDQGLGTLLYTVTSDCGFHVDSYLELELLNPTTGFQLRLDDAGDPIQSNGEYLLLPNVFRVLDENWSAATAKPEDIQVADGMWIARKVRIKYQGGGVPSGTYTYDFEVLLGGVVSPPLIQIRATPGVATRASRYIDNPAPYTGPEQMDFCSGRVYKTTAVLNIEL